MHVLAELEEVEKQFSIEDGLVVVSTKYFRNYIFTCSSIVTYMHILITSLSDWSSQCKIY